MPKLLPPRPQYAKERSSFSYPIFACFAVLFAARCFDKFFDVNLGSIFATVAISILAFLVPTLAFAKWRGRGYLRSLRFHRPYFTHTLLLISAFLALVCGSVLFSILFGGTDSIGTSTTSYAALTLGNVGKILLMIPTLVLLPAFLEELLFRGVLCSELDRRGVLRSVLVSSLLFALMHFDLSNLLFYFLAGALLSLVLYATDSVICTMILHAAYNLASLFGRRYINVLYRYTGSRELFLFIVGMLLLLSLLVFCLECVRLYRMRTRAEVAEPRRNVPMNVQIYTFVDALFDWPVLACIVLSIVGFIVL